MTSGSFIYITLIDKYKFTLQMKLKNLVIMYFTPLYHFVNVLKEFIVILLS